MGYPESFVGHLPEKIMCAAIHYDDGNKYKHQPKNIEIGIVVCGRRHHNCIATASQLAKIRAVGEHVTQGFLTTKDRFLNREESYNLALSQGLVKESDNKTLISEELW